MTLTIYQVDAFASELFSGNPAAVCPLESWLADDLMQSIAAENNLSETVFFVAQDEGFHIRWFTPMAEVDLCGHATLAAAFILFNQLSYSAQEIIFYSRSGELKVTKKKQWLTLNFPLQAPKVCLLPRSVKQGMNIQPIETFEAVDLILIYENEQQIAELTPDFNQLKEITQRGVIVTAPSKSCDFVVRYFAPELGVPEDPVTGSAYTQLAPFWQSKLNKKNFHANQLSSRGGELKIEIKQQRVLISGQAVLYLTGEIQIG
ncbi:MAG: PhzF family phenazine biosynthesis protein [Enterobacterales bacterium]|nr:PhzF family phenazine biosynthesis protein [Enterobacterales bacterium]